jgi:predicted PurR-regulated permease PerM
VLQPLIMGKALSLHPLAILLALTAGTVLAGVIGAVLAVPAASVTWTAIKAWDD